MKLGLVRATFFSTTVPPPKLRHLRRPICTVSTETPKTPLFLRPPTFSATISELKTFQNWAKTLASSVGSSFLELDNGPDSQLLHRELNWLLQDALLNPNILETHDFLEKTQNSQAQGILENPSILNNEEDTKKPGIFHTQGVLGKSVICENEGFLVALRVGLDELYALWKQRIEERRPFQYVVGCEHWRDLVLSVEEGVLIPRPETELIVELVEEVVKGNVGLRDGLWADLGTGSGALAIAICRVLGDSGRVVGVDLSPVAVEVAAYNVRRCHLQDKIKIKQGSWFEPLEETKGGLSGLVSNPPYIPSKNISGLQAEVGKHEPRLALDGGSDGMRDLLHLCNGAASFLKPGGFFAFETNGEDQCKFLDNYIETRFNGCFYNVKIVPDFAGIKRFVTGFKSG